MYDLLDMTCIPVDIVMKLDGLFPIVGDSQVHIEDVKWEPGGSGNIFVFFNRLGGKVLPLAPIGNDIYGRWLKEVYEEEGIETKALIVTEGYHTQVANAIIDKNGVHTFASTLPSVAFGDDELFKELSAQSRSYYLTGYSVAGDRDLALAQNSMKLLRGFHEAGKPIFFDPGPRVRDIDPDMLEEIINKSTISCFNHHEATLYSGMEQVEEAAEYISKRSNGIVIVKDGGNGCYVIDEDKKGRWYPGFKVKKIDTMAAGDVFFSAVMYGYLKGWEMKDYITLANASGAAKARKSGTGRCVPTVEEVKDVLRENDYSWIKNKEVIVFEKK